MKFLSALLLVIHIFTPIFGQNTVPDHFIDGKSVVFISNAPSARPVMEWKQLAEVIHPALVDVGGDPVAYYELEDITLSEEVQSGYAEAFNKRKIASIVILTRKTNNQIELHISPYTQNKAMIQGGGVWGIQANNVENLIDNLNGIANGVKSRNLLVLEVPEFPIVEIGGSSTNRFLTRNPLNLDVFKIGVQLGGTGGDAGLLNAYRYDLLGKSPAILEAEQAAERQGLETIFKNNYPNQVEFLTTAKSDEELVRERIQFVLVRVEGREGDLMESMGLSPSELDDPSRIVIKYYIRLIVRNELYLGPKWDADPDWRKALSGFLRNLEIKE